MRQAVPYKQRFWKFVIPGEPDECWEWQGARRRRGYGQLRAGDQMLSAHRVSYEIHHGPIPADLMVLHSCDNPPCVNPAHLSVGTRVENARQMLDRKRSTRKLSDEDAAEIRSRRAAGETLRSIAASYDIAFQSVSKLLRGRTYRAYPTD